MQLLTILFKLLNFGFHLINFFNLLFEAIILTKSPFLLFETKISTFLEVCFLNAFATSRTEIPLL